MAKKRAVAAQAEPNRELTNTLVVDDKTYNINAVQANKVANSLTITDCSDNSDIVFDGSTAKSISVMTPDGGHFTGRITIDQNNDIKDNDILNCKDIRETILANIEAVNKSIIYLFDEENIDQLEQNLVDNALTSISIVRGKEESVETFAGYNNDKYNSGELYLSVYLYISSDTNRVYYGQANEDTAYLLDINSATKANSLVESHTIQTNLGSDVAQGFNGTEDITPGVTGVLKIEHGGTGANNITEAVENIVDKQVIKPKSIVIGGPNNSQNGNAVIAANTCGIDLQNSDIIGANAIVFTDLCDSAHEGILFLQNAAQENYQSYREYFNKTALYDRLYSQNGRLCFIPYDSKVNMPDDNGNIPHPDPNNYQVYHDHMTKPIPIDKGGTGSTKLDDVTVGTAKSINSSVTYKVASTTKNETKPSKITISCNAPSGGNDGDIWIKY